MDAPPATAIPAAPESPPPVKWFLRPPGLVLTSAAPPLLPRLVLWLPLPTPDGTVPVPLAPGEQEIVFLAPATNTSGWERFVQGIRRAVSHAAGDHPGLTASTDAPAAFPVQTYVPPEVVVRWPGRPERLVIRW